jgi:translation initiation factor IF-2
MQQRRLRLGDILDDYCPRERRITNHVVVAMIEDDVRQTRCSTCDAEHEYKQAKAPAPRRKKSGALQEVLEDARPRAVAAPQPAPEDAPSLDASSDQLDADAPETGTEPASQSDFTATEAARSADAAGGDDDELDERPDDDGPVHRRLIRATLPRPEGQAPEWKEPDFTMRQPGREANGNRPGQQRARGHRPARQAQGPQGGQNRFGGPRPSAGAPRHGSGAANGQGGQGQRQGNRPGQPSHRGGGGTRPAGQNRGPGPGRKRGR